MSGLQTIIDNSSALGINRRNVVGIQYTRSEIPRISATPTKNPWKLRFTLPSHLKYFQARAFMEAVDTLDTTTPETISFANSPGLSWMWRYQGQMTPTQRAGLRVSTFVGDVMTLTGLPGMSSGSYMFKPNDLIQIQGHPFPFTVTANVLRGSSSLVSFVVHRPNILTGSVVNLPITIGNACQWRMFCPNMPTYKLIVGGSSLSYGELISNAYIEWSDDFLLYEFVSEA